MDLSLLRGKQVFTTKNKLLESKGSFRRKKSEEQEMPEAQVLILLRNSKAGLSEIKVS